MSWQTTANDRLSDYKENAMKKMSATTSRSGGNDVEARARKEKNTEEDGKVESLLLKNMARERCGCKHRRQMLQSDEGREL
jgi:hypothetical protein